jgi:RNA polymerase sporulation-specific sigma factor
MYKSTQVRELVVLCRNHNDDAFDELVQRYTPMMRKVIARFESSSYEFDELFSEACVALHVAAQRYDLDQDEVTFGLYARICVRNRLLDMLRRAESDQLIAELDVEQMSDEDSVEEKIVDRELFDRLLVSAKNLLSDYEYRVLLLHIQGYKTATIATKLSRSPKSVDNAKSRLFRRLRDEVGDISKF